MKRQSPVTNVQFLFAALLLLVVFFPLAAASAQTRVPTDDEVNAIARKLYCPVCESTPLDVCPTDACKEWREQIRTLLAEGKTEEEIFAFFELQYGARVLAEPPRKGFFWLMYVVPPVLILAGAFILFRSMKNWSRKPEPAAAEEIPDVEDDYLKRMEEELKKQK